MVYDLLKDNGPKRLGVSQEKDTTKGFCVKDLTEYDVSNMKEIMDYLKKGETNRQYTATSMNSNSSRSHVIFRLRVSVIKTISTEDMQEIQKTNEVTTESLLSFVDLAGSERVGTANNASKKLRKEGQNINIGLFYLQ